MNREHYRRLVMNEPLSRPTDLDLASDPSKPAHLLAAMADGCRARLQERGCTRDEQRECRNVLAALHRNPAFPSERLRALLADGDPDAWANPSLDLALLERPMGQDEQIKALVTMALRLAGRDVARAYPDVRRLREAMPRLYGLDHPAWHRWRDVLRQLADGAR